MFSLKCAKRSRAIHGLVLLIVGLAGFQVHAQSFEQVAAGAAHICALGVDGQVECTTKPQSTRFLPPDDLPLMREISAGQQHTCGITLEDKVRCWGVNAFDVLNAPVFDAPVISLSTGFNHTCAIDSNNQVQCWGLSSNQQLLPPASVDGFVKVDAGGTATCCIALSGDIHCWSSDSLFNITNPVPGPFIDLDTDSGRACGLTANGTIECWAGRSHISLDPPTSGPYTDLVVTNLAICGLRTDQTLDCSFAVIDGFDQIPGADQYPLNERFSSIERSRVEFGGVPICGIRADTGTISCFGGRGDGSEGNLPAPPGAPPITAELTASNFNLGLNATVYSYNQVELFWNQLPSAFPRISVEVYRDDELLATTGNSFSFYDNDTSVTNDITRYRVRTVDEAGNTGEFSNVVVVNRSTREVGLDSEAGTTSDPRPAMQLRVRNLSIASFNRFVNNDRYILTWNIDNPADIPVAGYEVRINNEPVGYVSDTAFIGDGVDLNFCRIYSVAAIADDGRILDYASAALGRSAIICPR